MKLGVEQRKQAADRMIRLLENISEPFITVDSERVVHANLAAQRLFGSSPDGLIGKSIGQSLPELAEATFRETFRKVAEDGREASIEAHFKRPAVDGDGTFSVRVFPSSDGIGLFFQRHGRDEELIPRGRVGDSQGRREE